MKHLLLKAATTATDQGTFEAVISTGSVDREGDIVEPSAFIKALEKWVTVGKLVPLDYNHSGEVIGHIDPATARVEGNEVIAKGFIDQTIPRGEESWRLVKSGTLSFSFGFLVPDGGATKRAGKKSGYHITELDLFEISVVPVAPANNDTRVLSYKSLASPAQMAEQMTALADELGADNPPDAQAVAGRVRALADEMAGMGKALADVVEPDLSQHDTQETVDETDKDASRSVDPLRKQAESTALEFASDGLSLQRPPKQVVVQKPEPELSLADLKRRMRDEVLIHLSGEEI